MNISNKQPFFFDTTLRDGNQALARPWNPSQKKVIFKLLQKLKVQAIEVGFPSSNEMDFKATHELAKIADDNTVIVALSRAVKKEIEITANALAPAKKPRLNIVLTLSPEHMRTVLEKPPEKVRQIAIEAVRHAKKVMPHAEIQFSVEHFGACKDNIPFVIDTLKEIIREGATIINLPNTVEREFYMNYVNMVKEVRDALPNDITIGVHCHNDLGMATAATVASYFMAGATQLECTINGLGERAGNANLNEVAMALHNSGVDVPLQLDRIYDTSVKIAELSNIPISPKAPLVGSEVMTHRSGIHQDGTIKTSGQDKGAYDAFNAATIGRPTGNKIGFTSQSGKRVIDNILRQAGQKADQKTISRLMPKLKAMSEKRGELSSKQIINAYTRMSQAIKT